MLSPVEVAKREGLNNEDNTVFKDGSRTSWW